MHRRDFRLPSLAKWILLGIILILIAIFIYLVFLYSDIQKSKTNGFSNAEQRVLEETDLVDIEETLRYQDEALYHVVIGKTKADEGLIVFVPEGDEEKLTIVNQNEILPYDTVLANWMDECVNCELVDIVPAIIKGNALWEITYYDEANRYVLNYVSIFDGIKYEEFRFIKMFD
ncbi:DUF5590 domain-containing protein [Paucisalibacillus globulus]|uniref:cell wall elongation regulator TseB-like domain-containing protein n=1 Tax=Paucisalibacillus globulus TaxID=351095 RepID=UPI0003FBB0D3|nr:DUF5590 domain-containing protein [Paucisalibacillus globulus]